MKKIFILLLIVISAFSLSACSNNKQMDKKALAVIQEKIVSESMFIESIEEISQVGKKETEGMIEYTFNVTYIDTYSDQKRTLNADYLLYVTPTKDNKDFIVFTHYPNYETIKEI